MKKILSVILSIVMLLSVSFGMNINAYALNKTADDAINWCKSLVGQEMKYQCVELINQYCTYLGTTAPRVYNAKEFKTYDAPPDCVKLQGVQPQKGDILIFTGSSTGHVCIYESDYSTYHHNYGTASEKKLVTRQTKYYKDLASNYWGVIRPNFLAVKEVKLLKTSYTYTGLNVKPMVVARDVNNQKINKKENYTITYPKKCKAIGPYALTVKFNGKRYNGTYRLKYKVVPKKTKITKTSADKSSVTVNYKKVSGVTGYQIQTATDSKFTQNVKTYAAKKTSRKVSKLKSGTTYYVRVRAYKTVKKKKFCSGWSKTAKVKTKGKSPIEMKISKLLKGHYLYFAGRESYNLLEYYFTDDNNGTLNWYNGDDIKWKEIKDYNKKTTYKIKGNCITIKYYIPEEKRTETEKFYYYSKTNTFKTKPHYFDYEDSGSKIVDVYYYSKTKIQKKNYSSTWSKINKLNDGH